MKDFESDAQYPLNQNDADSIHLKLKVIDFSTFTNCHHSLSISAILGAKSGVLIASF